MRIVDVVRYKRSKVIARSRITNAQAMILDCFVSFTIEAGIRKLPCAAPFSPGDTLMRIVMAINWSRWQEGIVRIDLFKLAQEILLENNLYAGDIDFDNYLYA